jgi:hypothetical protein
MKNRDGQELIEYFLPNCKIDDLEVLLRDYCSQSERPESIFVSYVQGYAYTPDQKPRKVGSAKAIEIFRIYSAPALTINVLIEGIKSTIGIIEFTRLTNRARIRFTIFHERYIDQILEFISEFGELSAKIGCPLIKIDEVDINRSEDRSAITRKMSRWRVLRANLFKELKEKHPDYSQMKLADYATITAKERIRKEIENNHPTLGQNSIKMKVDEEFRERYGHGKDSFNVDDVKNDYKAMGWEWNNSRNIT